MSKLLPKATIQVVRTFNDLAVNLIGVDCTLYIPNNLTALESATSTDMYTMPSAITYTTYYDEQVWIEWAPKDLHRLRKLGVFAEHETPILARFRNEPEVILGSYVTLTNCYIPDDYDTDEFEVVDVLMSNTYDHEIYRWYKMAPRRAK